MKKISAAVYAAALLSLAAASFLSPSVYGSLWFFVLWGLFAAAVVAGAVTSRMWRRPGVLLLHLSFPVMLAGGLLTWLYREKGSVRIEPGETAVAFTREDGARRPLPVPLRLERFEVVRYPGGEIPRDYVSHLVAGGEKRTVSVNRILETDGFRFSQSSYDTGGATVLSVCRDPLGIAVSYAGYLLFALGGAWALLSRRGRFRTLLKGLAAAAVLLLPSSASAAKADGIPVETADSLGRKAVVYGGRTVTFNTLSRDVLTKLYGRADYRGLTAEQTLVSFRLFPESWKDRPLILIKDKRVREKLGIEGNLASLSDLFDSEGNYRVTPLYSELPQESRRALEELDEKGGILLSLLSGSLIVAAGEDALPEWRVSLELLYNRLPLSSLIFMTLFTAFLLSAAQGVWRKVPVWLPRLCLSGALALSAANFAMQWVLAGRFPVSNTYETLEFTVIGLELLTLFSSRGGGVLMSLGALGGSSLALVAHLVEMNPVVTPLMPVLHSPWLSLHVSLVMSAYALLGFASLAGAGALLPFSRAEISGDSCAEAARLSRLAEALLYPGIWLLGTGIFSGAVWAEVSWGEYWSWDPKETWALVTLLVYALPLHLRLRPRAFSLFLLFALLSIAMTYFGVNHLDSLHAYS